MGADTVWIVKIWARQAGFMVKAFKTEELAQERFWKVIRNTEKHYDEKCFNYKNYARLADVFWTEIECIVIEE